MERMRSILGALGAGAVRPPEKKPAKPLPFVTISRQAGALSDHFLDHLIERLRELDPADPPWTGFDRTLVEKVVAEQNIFQPLVESLEDRPRSWLQDLFVSLSTSGPEPTELTVYRRVAKTVRALAQVGRVVVVGRGGMCITRDMPTGLHLAVVAPLDYRIEQYAKQKGVSKKDAEAEVRRIDQARQTFFRRYWPQYTIGPEMFGAGFNTGQVSESRIIDAIMPLLPTNQDAAAKTQSAAAR